jgi:glutathione S-transferase
MSHSTLSYAGAKLYYTSTSCGSASFIAAHAAGLKGLQVEQVDLKTHVTSKGKDFYSINHKGNVPTLVLADGTVLNEGTAVLQFIADQKPEAKLAAPYGTVERYKLMNALNHIASEVHTRIGGLFLATDATREFLLKRANDKLAYLDKEIKGQFYVGDHFTIADSYLYVVLNWTQWVGLSLDSYPNVKKYYEGIKALPVVVEARKLMEANPEKLE